ncbi:hypothetical protein NKI98_29325 [Mesorhizobium sp. M0222]|uniref:hypothetical protein n=1 Tax=Mesorhizobium sp. M0222 TaxID=2956921 RepID=UPI00333B2895
MRPLNDQLADLLKGRLDDKKMVAFGSGGTGLRAKRRNPTLTGLIQRDSNGLAAPGWWHLESYASEHYFVLEGDEESSGSEGPFHNDRIRIEVEIGDSPFVDEDAAPTTADDGLLVPAPPDTSTWTTCASTRSFALRQAA